MTLAWMFYALVTCALIGVAALLLERAAQFARLPARHIWLTAIAFGAMGPLALFIFRQPGTPLSDGASIVPFAGAIDDVTRAVAARAGTESVARLDSLAFIFWAVASATLLARLAYDTYRIARLRKSWKQTLVDGQFVRVAPECGPAVVGTTKMEIVLPEWILSFDETLRKLILRHEDEHRRARDPLLLHVARVLVVLFPWQLALHWQLKRLRLAVEVDCDARVLRAHPDADRYTKLLMAIALLRSSPQQVPAFALAENTSQLEERIMAIRRVFSRRRVALAIAATAAAILVIVAACNITEPTGPAPGSEFYLKEAPQSGGDRNLVVQQAKLKDTLLRLLGESELKGVQSDQPFFSYEVEKMAQLLSTQPPIYPPTLKDSREEGKVLVQFVVDMEGRADMSTYKVVNSSNALFNAEVAKVLPVFLFKPAEIGGRKVRMYVQLPFEFKLPK